MKKILHWFGLYTRKDLQKAADRTEYYFAKGIMHTISSCEASYEYDSTTVERVKDYCQSSIKVITLIHGKTL